MKTPEVRIYFSRLLYGDVSVPLNELWNKDGKRPFATPKQCEEYAENYRQEWATYNDNVLMALTESLGLEFYRSVIDVPCIPWVRASSDPLIMNFKNFPDQFVDALTHELCHVLLTDNTAYSIKSTEKEFDLKHRWTKLFGEEDFTAAIHIPVHALCKYVYLDVLKEPTRLERDMEDVKNNPPYKAAWDYVNEHDYREIIAQLRQDYKELKQELAA